MGDLHGHATFLADPDGFHVGGLESGRLPAHVREVVPAALGHAPGEGDQLLGRAVDAWRVHEAGRIAPGTRVDRFREVALHGRLLVGGGRPVLAAHRRVAEGAVAHELHHVDRGAEPAEMIEVLAEALPRHGRLAPDAADPVAHRLQHAGGDGPGREAAHAHHLGGDALPHLGLCTGARVVDEIRVRVDIDEARSHHEPFRVDHAGGGAAEVRADGSDAVALDGHIGSDAGCAAAVDYGAALEKERPGHTVTRGPR